MDSPPAAPDITRVLQHNRAQLFCIPAALFVLIFLMLRLGRGSRLKVCAKVLHTYPLEYRTRVVRKSSQWMYLGTVHTVRLTLRGHHAVPSLRALIASTVTRPSVVS